MGTISLIPSALSFVFLWHASSDSAEVLADAWRRCPADRSWSVFMHDCFAVELTGECLRCSFRLTRGGPYLRGVLSIATTVRWFRGYWKLCALSSSPTFSSSKLTPAISHGLLTPTASCDSQPLPGTGPNKQNGSQQAINFLLAQNFSATSATSGLLVCALDHHAYDQALRCALLCSPFRRQ